MHYRLLILFTLVTSWSWGQDTLSLDRVWQEGLANNFDVAIARQSLAVLENNREYQWLTYTPELTVDAGVSARTQDVSLTFASGDVQERAGAGTFSGNAGATVSYRVFEGMGKKFRIQSTQLTETQGEHALEAQMEATVANLTQAYYALVVARNQARVLQTTLALSRERVSLAQAQYQVGKASKLEYLQAQVDYNADSSQWLAQQELVQAAAIQLNQMMARDPNLPVIPVATIPLDTSLKYDVLLAAMEENPALHVQDVAIELAQANERLAATGFYPTLDASLNYGYNYSDAEAGFVLQNRTSGVSGGLTLRWSLSGTLDARRQVENALLQSQTAQLTREPVGNLQEFCCIRKLEIIF